MRHLLLKLRLGPRYIVVCVLAMDTLVLLCRSRQFGDWLETQEWAHRFVAYASRVRDESWRAYNSKYGSLFTASHQRRGGQ